MTSVNTFIIATSFINTSTYSSFAYIITITFKPYHLNILLINIYFIFMEQIFNL